MAAAVNVVPRSTPSAYIDIAPMVDGGRASSGPPELGEHPQLVERMGGGEHPLGLCREGVASRAWRDAGERVDRQQRRAALEDVAPLEEQRAEDVLQMSQSTVVGQVPG